MAGEVFTFNSLCIPTIDAATRAAMVAVEAGTIIQEANGYCYFYDGLQWRTLTFS